MSLPDDHGVILLARMLDELDGRQVRVTVHGARANPATRTRHQGTAVGPTREDIERIAADVVDRKLDYRERRR